MFRNDLLRQISNTASIIYLWPAIGIASGKMPITRSEERPVARTSKSRLQRRSCRLGFDPSLDSSVRVAIGRLRTALSLFEQSPFADTDIIVDIPVGTYRPKMKQRTAVALAMPTTGRSWTRIATGAVVAASLVIAALIWTGALFSSQSGANDAIVIEIEAFSGDTALSDTVSTSLRRALSRNQAITVAADQVIGQISDETDLVLQGATNLRQDNRAFIALELLSVATQNIVWAKAIELDNDAFLPGRVTQVLGSELRIRVFGATKLELEQRDPKTLSPEQLFVMATWVPGPAMNAVEWELERVRLMGIALEKDPDFGSAHSVMADKLAYLANVYGPSNTEALRRDALVHAQSANELSPLNPDVMFNVAQAMWHSGQIGASRAVMRRAMILSQRRNWPGIDPDHFAHVTVPRLCSENQNHPELIRNYEELANNIRDKI